MKTSIFASSFHPPSLCRFFLGVVSATLVHVFCTWAMEATPAVRNHTRKSPLTPQTIGFNTRDEQNNNLRSALTQLAKYRTVSKTFTKHQIFYNSSRRSTNMKLYEAFPLQIQFYFLLHVIYCIQSRNNNGIVTQHILFYFFFTFSFYNLFSPTYYNEALQLLWKFQG